MVFGSLRKELTGKKLASMISLNHEIIEITPRNGNYDKIKELAQDFVNDYRFHKTLETKFIVQ